MKIFKKIKLLVQTILSHAGSLVDDCVKPGLLAVETLKEVVNNPALDLITELTKTELDNAILKKVRGLFITIGPLVGLLSSAKPTEFVEAVRALPPAMQSAVYLKTASGVAVALSNGKLSESDADTLTQLAYAQHKAALA